MKFNTVLAAAVLGLAGSVAQAATYTFDFANRGVNHASLHVASNENPGFGVTVQAYNYTLSGSNYVLGNAIDVDTNSYGLISDNANDGHAIDSSGPDELMKFTFDGGKNVTLTSVVISWFSGTGWYDVFANGTLAGNTKDGAVLPAGPANMFSVGARSIKNPNYSYFKCMYYGMNCKKYLQTAIKIKSITVAYDDQPPGGVIPLPAAGWLMLGALGGLGALRRRKG